MSARTFRLLGFGLVATDGAGMLTLTSTLAAAPALADTGSFEPGGGFDADSAWVMGPSGFPLPAQSYLDAANILYLGLPTGAVQPLYTPEGLYPITGVNTLDTSVAQGVEALDNVLQKATGPVDVFGYS